MRLASIYVGIEPFSRANPNQRIAIVSRYDRKKKEHEKVDCPQIYREYNNEMGRVHLMDGLMGRYHIRDIAAVLVIFSEKRAVGRPTLKLTFAYHF